MGIKNKLGYCCSIHVYASIPLYHYTHTSESSLDLKFNSSPRLLKREKMFTNHQTNFSCFTVKKRNIYCHETLILSLLAMSLEDRFCMSRKVVGGSVHDRTLPKGTVPLWSGLEAKYALCQPFASPLPALALDYFLATTWNTWLGKASLGFQILWISLCTLLNPFRM